MAACAADGRSIARRAPFDSLLSRVEPHGTDRSAVLMALVVSRFRLGLVTPTRLLNSTALTGHSARYGSHTAWRVPDRIPAQPRPPPRSACASGDLGYARGSEADGRLGTVAIRGAVEVAREPRDKARAPVPRVEHVRDASRVRVHRKFESGPRRVRSQRSVCTPVGAALQREPRHEFARGVPPARTLGAVRVRDAQPLRPRCEPYPVVVAKCHDCPQALEGSCRRLWLFAVFVGRRYRHRGHCRDHDKSCRG